MKKYDSLSAVLRDTSTSVESRRNVIARAAYKGFFVTFVAGTVSGFMVGLIF